MLLVLNVHVFFLDGRHVAEKSPRKSVILSFDSIVFSLPHYYIQTFRLLNRLLDYGCLVQTLGSVVK